MQVFDNIKELRQFLSAIRQKGQSIGLVPTMGALHHGHLSLLAEAQKENEVTVCSIYVNPTQFENATDLAKYPRLMEQDLALLQEQGCSAVFAPSDKEMYPQGLKPALSMDFGRLETIMEGKYRKGHFNGVGVVVSKLFHIVQPDRAYFGQKDLQQFAVIHQLVSELSFSIELKRCPIIREEDGLALSSRNLRLSPKDRTVAPRLYETLQLTEKLLLEGEGLSEIRNQAISYISKHRDFKLEYFEITSLPSLEPLEQLNGEKEVSVCIAAHLGQIRLIDNIIVALPS